MALVFKIMISCPVTEQPLETGAQTTSRTALDSQLYQSGVVHCPHCKQLHTWQKENAFLKISDERARDELWRPNE